MDKLVFAVPVTPYPRHGRLEAVGYGRERDRPPSYTIIDAEPDADRRREFPLAEARYNRVPSPYYRRRPELDYPRRPELDYSRRPELDYSRRPELDYSRRPELDYSRRPELNYAPKQDQDMRRPLLPLPDYRRPDVAYRGPQVPESGYRRPVGDPAGAPPGYRRPLLPADSSTPDSDPYRGYNPRQPAPWSMQIGARLTVKDDGRRVPVGGGGGPFGPGAASGRRFYVSSQAPGPHYAVPLRYS